MQCICHVHCFHNQQSIKLLRTPPRATYDVVVTSRFPEAGPAFIWQLIQDIDCPHRLTQVFSAHFVLTRAHPGRTFRPVTHTQISPGQARLTSEFFGDRLPEKKLQLVGMSILLIILSLGPECHTNPRDWRSHHRRLVVDENVAYH